MKKIIVIIEMFLIMLLCQGCTKKYYYEEPFVWYSEDIDIEFSFASKKYPAYIILEGKKYDIYVSHSLRGGQIGIYDETYLYDMPKIWKCDVEYNRKKQELYLTIVEDNYTDNTGMKFTLKSRPIEDDEKDPEDQSVRYAYNSRLDLLKKAEIPEEIYKVFSEDEYCIFNGKKTKLSEIENTLWMEFTFADIDSDGLNELIFETGEIEFKDANESKLYFFDMMDGEVYMYEMYHYGGSVIFVDGTIWTLEGNYKVKFDKGSMTITECAKSNATERRFIGK